MTSRPRFGEARFFAEDPDAALEALRRDDPVHWDEDESLWVLTRHRDVVEVSRDPRRFCSSQGVLLSDRDREVTADDSLLYLDPPRHAAYRKLVSRAFTPRRVAGLEPWMRQMTIELLDAIEPHEPVDLVDALTAPLPLAVIAQLLGLPAGDRPQFRRWSDGIMKAATALDDESAILSLELITYLESQLEARRDSQPGDGGASVDSGDLLDALLRAEVEGERLTQAELIGFCMTLLVAGNETTRSMLTGGLLELAEHPEQRKRLTEHPELVPDAIEEMLRWVTPIMAMARTTTEPVEIDGRTIGADRYVALVYGAANRDEDVFGGTASRFDAFRTPNPHVAFGFGEHFCIGASLARLEGRVVLSELLRRWPGYQVVGPAMRAPSSLLRQIVSVPVLFAP